MYIYLQGPDNSGLDTRPLLILTKWRLKMGGIYNNDFEEEEKNENGLYDLSKIFINGSKFVEISMVDMKEVDGIRDVSIPS